MQMQYGRQKKYITRGKDFDKGPYKFPTFYWKNFFLRKSEINS